MHMMMKLLFLASITLLGAYGIAQAQTSNGDPKTGAAPVSRLQWVTEGMFELKLGGVKDLTDRKVLMTFPRGRYATEDNITIKINGEQRHISLGERFNLKQFGSTRGIFNDMSECYLDLINVAFPKGVTPFATFRFVCH